MKKLEAKPFDQNAENWKREIQLFTSTVLEAGASGQNRIDTHAHTLRPRLHVSGSSGYPAPDRPFVYTYPGQMYAIRSIMVRYPERFENDFKGGQPGCLDPFSASVNGVPGYPDRFSIHFYGKKNSSRLFTWRVCFIWSFSINFCFSMFFSRPK